MLAGGWALMRRGRGREESARYTGPERRLRIQE
jgi:hypothetical protein